MTTVVQPVASMQRFIPGKYRQHNSFPSLPRGLFTDVRLR